MSLLNFNANIEADAVMEQLRAEQEEKMRSNQNSQQREYNPKRYLNVNLGKQEESKQLVIRLLPFSADNGTPFHKIHMHTVRVNGEVTTSGWKTLTCSMKNSDIQDKHPCPFCDMSAEARNLAGKTLNEAEKKRLNDISFLNRAKEMWIVRCIERGAEEDGVKFWMFPNPKSRGGIFDTIMNIYKTRKEAGERRGEVRNIFDLSKGKDLIITIKKGADGKKKIDVVDDDEFTPLTEDVELGNSWINDSTKWDDLYPVKREDYMSILVEGGVPYWDKEQKCYVDKETYQESANIAKEAKTAEQLAQVTEYPVDYTVPTPQEEANGVGIPQEPVNHVTARSSENVTVSVTNTEMPPQPNWEEDDLPF